MTNDNIILMLYLKNAGTEIGGMLKSVQSARKVKLLLTELGKSCAILKDTMKKHLDGTPILQVRWFEKIVEFYNMNC